MPPIPPISRIAGVVAVTLWLALVIPLASIEISLLVSPSQGVDAAGQSLTVSASPAASTSGPGTLELFGQSIPTTQQFSGPIRPRLLWAQVTHYDQLLLALKQPEHLGKDLRSGWSAYFARQLVVAVLVAAALGALSLALLRLRWQLVVAGMVVALAVAGIVDAAAIGSAAQGLQQLSQVRTLDQLVGRSPLAVGTTLHRPTNATATTVVIGDSTAAGAGFTMTTGGGCGGGLANLGHGETSPFAFAIKQCSLIVELRVGRAEGSSFSRQRGCRRPARQFNAAS